MKRIFLIGLLLSFKLYSQEKPNEYKKLVDSAITIKSNQALEDFNHQLRKNINTENWRYYIENYKRRIENTYLIDENHQPYIIQPSNELGIKFKQMDIYDSKNKKELKKGISAWKIVSGLNENKLKIDIIEFTINYANKKYIFANGGGSTFIYEYSCEEKKWILISNKTNVL
ncbi:hypothetical protein [Flavobacterium microcysteis]